jgi:hypothetical protein
MALRWKRIRHYCLTLYQRDFFKDIKSVMDMGDQDMYVTFDEIKKKI